MPPKLMPSRVASGATVCHGSVSRACLAPLRVCHPVCNLPQLAPAAFARAFPPRRPWRSAPGLWRVSSPRLERGATPALRPRHSGGRRPAAARVHTPGVACPAAGSGGGAGALATMPLVFLSADSARECTHQHASWGSTPYMPRCHPLSTPSHSWVRLWSLMTVIAQDIVALCVLPYMEGCQHGQ
jgi:hypothetical protein